jgi:hypothetical protein
VNGKKGVPGHSCEIVWWEQKNYCQRAERAEIFTWSVRK